MRRRGRAWVAVTAATLLVTTSACGSDGSSSASSAAPTSASPSTSGLSDTATSTAAPTSAPSTGAPVATDATTTTAPFANPEIADGPCTFSAVDTSITYVDGARLVEVAPDGSRATCIAQLDAPPAGPVVWSPGGDRALVGGDRVVGPEGTMTSGYLPENQGVHWSYPTGKALVAPSVRDGSLVWRSSTDSSNRIDISFLADTHLAVYHPAGKNVVAAGVAADGVAGLFIASNRGENMRPVALLEHPDDAIVEMAFWTSGDRMLFVHDHGDSFELHTVVFPSLGLTDVARYDEPVGDVRIGTDPLSRAAYRVGDCSGATSVMVHDWAGTPVEIAAGTPVAERSLRPVGWTDAGHLVVESRVSGCTGQADVWVLGMDGTTQQVLAGVEHVAVRDAVRGYGELPDDLNTDAEYR